MALPRNIVSDFENITRYPLGEYLNTYVNFINRHRINISSYYGGSVRQPNEKSFNILKSLLEKSESVNHMIEIHRERLNSGAFWELIEVLSNLQVSLWTIDNSSKWLRSSISKNNFTPDVEIEYVLKQLETLEAVSEDTGSNDRDNDWVTIALRNDLIEEDYTPDGGNLLVTGYSNKRTIQLESVVDNIFGEKVYGIDLHRVISFENEDLKALSYKETVVQAVTILASLRQGQTPEFPEDGIQSTLVVGSNRASIAYPVLFRQYYATFQRDDTLKSLTITKIENLSDSLEIDFTIETRLGEEIEVTSQL